MRFKGLDLNLLVALDCLLAERNVSRAAEKLFLSQSATSGALTRLREYFKDDLLVQLGRSMVMTPRATELAPAVRAALLQIEGTVIQRPQFDPATTKREIRIVGSEYMITVALSDAIREIKKEAPELNFTLLSPGEGPQELLERGEVDFLAMPDIYLVSGHPSIPLFSDDYRAIVWAENEALSDDTMTLEDFLRVPHVALNFTPTRPAFETWFTQRFGNERKVEVVSSSYSSLPFLVVGTQRIALMHKRMAEVYAKILPLKLIVPPVEIPSINEALQWNIYNDSDECLIWLRTKLAEHISQRLG